MTLIVVPPATSSSSSSSTTTADSIDTAMATIGDRKEFIFNKASLPTQGAAGFSSLWRAFGTPTVGTIPGAAAVCYAALSGSLVNFDDASGEQWYLARLNIARGNAGDNTYIYDRLAHMGGLSGVTTGNQTVNVNVSGATYNLANRCNQTTYEDVEWWAEIYSDIGTTGQTCTVTYTDAAGNTGNTTTFTLGGASPLNQDSRIFPISGAGGEFIKSIQTVSIGTSTGTAGSWGITARRRLAVVDSAVANRMEIFDYRALGLPPIPNQAHLEMLQLCITTSTGIAVGGGLMVKF